MNKYLKAFLGTRSCEDVVALFARYGGAAKEITESWGMLEAAYNHAPFRLNDCKVFIVGDGCSPRTGGMFAFYTKATVESIDPNFNMEHWEQFCSRHEKLGNPVQRLKLHKDVIENLTLDGEEKDVLVVWPHSHANMNSLKLVNQANRCDIALPCCEPLPPNWASIPHITYVDRHIASPKNCVHIF